MYNTTQAFRLPREARQVIDRLFRDKAREFKRLTDPSGALVELHHEASEPHGTYSSIWFEGQPEEVERARVALLDGPFRPFRLDPYPEPTLEDVRRELRELLSAHQPTGLPTSYLGGLIITRKILWVHPRRRGDYAFKSARECCDDLLDSYQNETGKWYTCLKPEREKRKRSPSPPPPVKTFRIFGIELRPQILS